MGTFRRLIVHAGVTVGNKGNVVQVDNTQMLNIQTESAALLVQKEKEEQSPFEDTSRLRTDCVDHGYACSFSKSVEGFVDNIVVYISGFVVRKAMLKISCVACRSCLVTSNILEHYSPMYQLLELKNKGGLLVPSHGLVNLLLATEKLMRRMMNVTSARSLCSKREVLYAMKSEYGGSDPLCLGDHIMETQHGIDNHFFDLLNLLVDIYYTLRQRHIARLHTSNTTGMSVRQKLTKLILFKGD